MVVNPVLLGVKKVLGDAADPTVPTAPDKAYVFVLSTTATVPAPGGGTAVPTERVGPAVTVRV